MSARLDPRVPVHDAPYLTVDEDRKPMASWIGDRRVALANSSTTFMRMPTLYCYLRCGDLRSPGVKERRNCSL